MNTDTHLVQASRVAGETDLDRTRAAFLLARAQLAAGAADQSRRDASMRRWPPHRRRFGA